MAGTVLFGALGIVLFQRLAQRILSPPAGGIAALALLLSPVYAMYSGFIMTEVPMLATLLAAALVLWQPADRRRLLCDVAGGVLFGLAVGIREQALTMGAAFLWIIWCRRPERNAGWRSTLRFCIAAGAVILAPAIALYVLDPAGFPERIRTWFHAVPLGSAQFRNNAEASVLYAFLICPGAWLAVA
jgi:4-amino-4-deoxy-L-arabinose transferase-like glycosyltransferase